MSTMGSFHGQICHYSSYQIMYTYRPHYRPFYIFNFSSLASFPLNPTISCRICHPLSYLDDSSSSLHLYVFQAPLLTFAPTFFSCSFGYIIWLTQIQHFWPWKFFACKKRQKVQSILVHHEKQFLPAYSFTTLHISSVPEPRALRFPRAVNCSGSKSCSTSPLFLKPQLSNFNVSKWPCRERALQIVFTTTSFTAL